MKKFRGHNRRRDSYKFGYSAKLFWYGKFVSPKSEYYQLGWRIPGLEENHKARRLNTSWKPPMIIRNKVSMTLIFFIWTLLVYIATIVISIFAVLKRAFFSDVKKAYLEFAWKPNYSTGFFFWMLCSIVLFILLIK